VRAFRRGLRSRETTARHRKQPTGKKVQVDPQQPGFVIPRHGRELLLLLLFAEQLAGRSIDEMKPAAGLAGYGFVRTLRIARRWFVRQPVLHVHSGSGTLEDDVIHGRIS
jgi:hypothetical protein